MVMRTTARWILSVALVAMLTLTNASGAFAQGRSLIRDAEIEATIRDFATPLFHAAGLDPQSVDIFIVKDDSLNAFVAGGQNLFLHTGLLLRTRDPLELIGVIAHETGHISGGHLARTSDAISSASKLALVTTILGVAAAVASGNAGAGAAVALGGRSEEHTSELQSLMRIADAVFCLKKKKNKKNNHIHIDGISNTKIRSKRLNKDTYIEMTFKQHTTITRSLIKS